MFGLRLDFYRFRRLRRADVSSRQRAAARARCRVHAGRALGTPFGITALAYGISALLLTGCARCSIATSRRLQFVAGALVSAAASVAAFFVLGFSFKILLVAGLAGVITPFSSLPPITQGTW